MNKTYLNIFVRFGVSLMLLLTLISCSSTQKKAASKKNSQSNLPHDPYSVPFHAAEKIAKAPGFTAELLNGKTFQLSKYKGQVVLLNFWATWCAPCREEAPELTKLYENFKNKNVEFLGISIDKQGRSVVVPFVKKYNVPYPITIDDGHILKKYGPVMGYPTTYIIGPKGNLRYFATGAITAKEAKPRIDALLKKESQKRKKRNKK